MYIMELIDRYVTEVGQHLPVKQRADLEKEIRSLIEDALDDRSQKESRPVDEDMLVELLKTYGPPEKMAASYLPPKYLVGPRWYGNFMLSFRLIMVIVAATSAIAFGVALGQAVGIEAVGKALLEFLGSLWSGVMQTLGILVLIFYIIENAIPKASPSLPGKKEWDPRSLKSLQESERIKTSDAIVNIVFTVLVMVLFTFYPSRIAIYNYSPVEKVWLSAPLLSEAFFRYLPFLDLLWGLVIVRYILLLQAMKWTPALRWFSMGISMGTFALLVAMLGGPSLVNVTAESLGPLFGNEMGMETARQIVFSINIAVQVSLALALAFTVVDLVKFFYNLITKSGAFQIEIKGK
jgi:hypothetical protein